MRFETNQDFAAAMARLSSRTPKALATFIASLVFEAGPIGEHARTFLIGDDLPALTGVLEGTH